MRLDPTTINSSRFEEDVPQVVGQNYVIGTVNETRGGMESNELPQRGIPSALILTEPSSAVQALTKYNETSSCVKAGWLSLNSAQYPIEILYLYFISLAVLSSKNRIFEIFNVDAVLQHDVSKIVDPIIYTFASLSFVCDVTAINPAQSAFEMITSQESLDRRLTDDHQLSEADSAKVKTMVWAMRLLCAWPSFFALGLSDAIAISELTPISAARWIGGTTVALATVGYYHNLTDAKIINDTVFYLNSLKTGFASTRQTIREWPMLSLEIAMQNLFTLTYRSFAAANMTYQLGFPAPLTAYAFFATAIVTSASRFLKVSNWILPDEFRQVAPIHLEEAHLTVCQEMGYGLAALVVRGLPTLLLVLGSDWSPELDARKGSAVAAAFMMTAHAYHVLRQRTLHKQAVEIMNRGVQIDEEVGHRDIVPVTARDWFEEIKAKTDNAMLSRFATTTVTVGRLLRISMFISFVFNILDGFLKDEMGVNVELEDRQLLGFALLVGTSIALAEFAFYVGSVKDTMKDYKIMLNKVAPEMAKEDGCGVYPRLLFTTPVETLSVGTLQRIAEQAHQDADENDMLQHLLS